MYCVQGASQNQPVPPERKCVEVCVQWLLEVALAGSGEVPCVKRQIGVLGESL